MIKNIIIVTLLFWLESSQAQNALYQYTGTIVADKNDFCEIFNQGKLIGKFRIRPEKKDFSGHTNNISFFGIKRLSDSAFIATESAEVGYEGTVKNNIVLLNIKGKVIDRIVESDKYHYAHSAHPSNSNKKILYLTHARYPPSGSKPTKEELLSALSSKEILHIMDYGTRKEELSVENFSKGGMLAFHESPWSPDERRFVYTIRRQSISFLLGDDFKDNDTAVGGSYIYDIDKKTDVEFIAGSYKAVWCPDSNVVAYLKQGSIWLYNTNTDIHTLFLKFTSNLDIDIHWTPDGNYLYVQYRKGSKIIEKLYTMDAKEVPFKKPKLKDRFYTWR